MWPQRTPIHMWRHRHYFSGRRTKFPDPPNGENMKLRCLFAALLGCLLMQPMMGRTHAEALKLDKGDHICLVGNELGERMQHHNFFELLLHHQFADQELTVRNLCFPGDEPSVRIRSKNFGSPESHLKHSGASVIQGTRTIQNR